MPKSHEAEFKTKMQKYKEELFTYSSWQIMETMDTDTSKINAGDTLKSAVHLEIVTDIKEEDVNTNIEDILTSLNKNDKDFVAVYKGELYYVSNAKIKNNEKQVQWCKDIGIKILEYVEPEGIAVKNGKYELVKGMYLCTPNLDKSFVQEKTRYLNLNETGYLTPGNWITGNTDDSWYDYGASKWANIIVENNGASTYYVWIPRYCFKLNSGTQRADVKFINTDNEYIDTNGTPEDKSDDVTTKVGEGILADYQVPKAFTFNETEIAGFWMMKYTAGDISSPSNINYDMSVSKGKISIKNITINTAVTNSNPIAKYTVALNGTIVYPNITDISKTIVLENLKAGNNYINVTGLNANGEIVGSNTKEYIPAVTNKPDTSGFDPNTTFYVTYDDNGNEHSTVPICKATPQYWYDYGETRWANIVTRNNGLETYYVWIPRYCFTLDQQNQRSTVKFLKDTSTEVPPSYQIPEAFKFNGKELTGFWMMKYTAGDSYAPKFNTDLVATNSSIKTKGITGTSVGTGQVYKYYIDGEYKGEKTTATDTFEYSGLNSNTTYTINIEVRNSSTNEYLGSITKQVKTIDANASDLSGFLESNTYYVVYDSTGTNITSEDTLIKHDLSNKPDGWYDYSNKRWANIVVKEGSYKTYYTWIPRYEFKITSDQQASPATGRTDVRFIEGTGTSTSAGYQIPEAFTFNGIQLRGYWMMKYTAG